MALSVVLALTATSVVASSGMAGASGNPTPPPSVVDAEILTPYQLKDQIAAAEKLRSALMRSGAQVAAANARLETLTVRANTLLDSLSVARVTQAEAEAKAATERARLSEIGKQVVAAQDALGQMASDSYMQGGGPLGDFAAILEALTAPSADVNTDSWATVKYLVDGRARLLGRLQALKREQGLALARSVAATKQASEAAKAAAVAKAKLDDIIRQQRLALDGLEQAQSDQVGRAAGLRGALLRSENSVARAADRRLAEALDGRDYQMLVTGSASCGKDIHVYPNGFLPNGALCPMYASSDERLRRDSAMGFNAMSHAYQRATGSPLCITDGYRPYAEQVAVHIVDPRMTATPGKSKHGLGIAVDLCGGVQNFGAPAHLWMQQHAPLYGWFHPGWAEPTGVTPEPWHWEFAA